MAQIYMGTRLEIGIPLWGPVYTTFRESSMIFFDIAGIQACSDIGSTYMWKTAQHQTRVRVVLSFKYKNNNSPNIVPLYLCIYIMLGQKASILKG